VQELVADGNQVIIKTAYGLVRANRVALATNIYSPLIKSARKYVVAVYDFQLVTEPYQRRN
jgi:glycine/D-amino acid oxidase-like deaminating enzyme